MYLFFSGSTTNHITPSNGELYISSPRKINVTHKIGNVNLKIKTGRGGASNSVFIEILTPGWGERRKINWLRNNLSMKKINKTLVASGVNVKFLNKEFDWCAQYK